MGQTDSCPFDLTGTGLLAKVVTHFPDIGDAGCGDWMAFRLQTARDVHREATCSKWSAGVEEVNGVAFAAQAKVVVVHQLCGCETIVKLDEIEIFRSDAGLFVGLLGCEFGEGVDVGKDLAGFLVGVAREDRGPHPNSALLLAGRKRLENLWYGVRPGPPARTATGERP